MSLTCFPLSLPRRGLLIARCFAVLICAFTALSATDAAAEIDDARLEVCFKSYETAQVRLKDGDLGAARATAEQCSAQCPEEIVVECSALVSQARRDMPTALPLATTERGTDAPNVALFVDGEETTGLLGEELELNPGAHELRFLRREDGWQETVNVVMRRGEKRRQIRVVVPDVAPPSGEDEKPKSQKGVRGLIITSYAVSGVGFGVAAVGGILGLTYRSKLNDCSPNCAPADADKWVRGGRTWLTVGDIGLAVGAAGALTGTALVIWGPKGQKNGSTAWFHVAPTAGGAAGLVSGKF